MPLPGLFLLVKTILTQVTELKNEYNQSRKNNQDLPKNIDRDSDKDNEDAADAYHRKHPVVHYLPV